MAACAHDENLVRADLHVHSANNAAQRFYARAGFAVAAVCPGYYAQLTPSDAKLLRRHLQPASGEVAQPAAAVVAQSAVSAAQARAAGHALVQSVDHNAQEGNPPTPAKPLASNEAGSERVTST